MSKRDIYSWTIADEDTLIKHLDTTSIKYNNTRIPKALKSFWEMEALNDGESRKIKLLNKMKLYSAVLQIREGRAQINWFSDFRRESELGEWAELGKGNAAICFNKLGKDVYDASFIVGEVYDEQIEPLSASVSAFYTDGKKVVFYGTKYERNKKNRDRAIQYHGCVCMACGFDFEAVYGEPGKGFIEVHHIKPLSSLQEEMVIDCKTDLVPVCSNCHRILHRNKEKMLSIEELKQLIHRYKC